MDSTLVQVIPWVGVLGMVVATITFFSLKKHPAGNEVMQEIAQRIYVGAMTFLKREYTIIAIFMVIVFIVLFFKMDSFKRLNLSMEPQRGSP